MKKMVVVSVRDKKVEAFHPSYCVPTKGIAIRAFGDAVSKGDSDLSNHPEDFSLFHVADFDLDDGRMIGVSPVEICSGLDFVGGDSND